MSELDSIDKKINHKIEVLFQKKIKNDIIFDYINNIYLQKIDEIIDKLKSINKEKSEKVKIILENSQKMYNFLNNFKSKNDFKKYLKEYINVFKSFHTIPYYIYKKVNPFINVKGIFSVKDLNTFSFNFFLKNYVKQNIPLHIKECLKIKYENKTINNILERKDEEEKKINREDKIKIQIEKKEEMNEYNKRIKEY